MEAQSTYGRDFLRGYPPLHGSAGSPASVGSSSGIIRRAQRDQEGNAPFPQQHIALVGRVFEEIRSSPSKTKRVVKALATLTFLGISVMDNLNYRELDVEGANNRALGLTSWILSSVGSVGTDIWAFQKMLNQILKKGEREDGVRLSTLTKISFVAASILIAFLGNVPVATALVDANGGGWTPALWALLSESALPSFAYFQSFTGLARLVSKKSEMERALDSYRDELTSFMAMRFNEFLNMGEEDQLAFAGDVVERFNAEDMGELLRLFTQERQNERIALLLRGGVNQDEEVAAEGEQRLERRSQRSCCRKLSEKIISSSAWVLALLQQVVLAKLASDGISDLTGSETTGNVVGIGIGVLGLRFTGTIVSRVATDTFNGGIDLCTGNSVNTVAEQRRPIISVVIKIVALVCAIFMYAGAMGMAEDAFSGIFEEVLGYVLSATFGALTYYTTRDVGNALLEIYLGRQGTEEEQKLLQATLKWMHTVDCLEKASYGELAGFLYEYAEDLPDSSERRDQIRGTAARYLQGLAEAAANR